MTNSMGFALAIRISEDGNIDVYSERRRLPQEIVLTVVRHWLRKEEDVYHKDFTS